MQAIQTKGNPVCVGLDPVADRLPAALKPTSKDPAHIARLFGTFCKAIIDVVAPLVPVVKPQAAFFEMYGAAGWQVLAEVVSHARQNGLIVVMDAKRGDIGNTATAYAQAFLDQATTSGLCSDALTINPYLGDDSMQPFLDVAAANGNGLFVLVKTSNPGGKLFQDLTAEGKMVYQHVAEYVETESLASAGKSGYGLVGAVVGATYPEQLVELRQSMPHAILLVPGFGAQGGKADDVAGAFDAQGLGAIVNSSRNIIFAHARTEFAAVTGWQRAVELATREMINQLAEVMKPASL